MTTRIAPPAASETELAGPDPGSSVAAWRRRLRRGLRSGASVLAYRLLRRAAGALPGTEFRIHQIIAIPPWRLRLPPRPARPGGGFEVRELELSQGRSAAELERLRPANGRSYGERAAAGHRVLTAWLAGEIKAFVWIAAGPAQMASSFGCRWQLPAATCWLYDLYSDPDTLGAIAHLYAQLRRQPLVPDCQLLLGQNEFDNVRSRQAHHSLGYEIRATLVSARCGPFHLHLSRTRPAEGPEARGVGSRARWHLHSRIIPLHRLAPTHLAEPATAPAHPLAPILLSCRCGRTTAAEADQATLSCVCGSRIAHRRGGPGAPLGFDPVIPYWGEIPQSDMRQVLAHAGQHGWRQAVETLVPAHLRDYVSSPQRADFEDLLPLPSGARILDVGAGWGAIATAFAQRGYQVTALEGVGERARFIAVRAAQEGLTRLQVLEGNVLTTPLAPAQFDLIIANGVLEWVALLESEGSPRAVQLAFLDHLRRLLRPGGLIYIGIENRFGWSEFQGELDHSGLPYTSLLPRPLARWVCAHSRSYRAHFNVGYRTYTYSHFGYRRLFAQASLTLVQSWISPGGYNQPAKLVPLHTPAIRFSQLRSRPSGLRAAVRRRLRSLTARAVVWRCIGSDFTFLLQDDGAPAPSPHDSPQAASSLCTP